ncbi:MAG: TRAP transporter small permease [Gammaproteobacteria bacterium]|jgi:TRAP-type C4-dicarboxylate transport system permease small subunit|nr:TRAP transporter small permease [Gammaproteobacteria bacterium]MBT4493170.1 TRAP transporter small permease [Gammaproteobacteria bacterium]MBT7371437.1 TRAP transporter small permease [Gammaproteobacteria bacterium]
MMSRLVKFTEAVAAALLLALFLSFLLQIFSRYILLQPFGWTVELCLTLWIWIVFWGNAFVVRHDQHVRFDMLYRAVQPRTRRLFALVSAAAIATAMAVSLYPTWDYVDFMKIQKSASLRIPLSTIFSVYIIFMAATALTYAWRFYQLLRHENPDAADDRP